MTTPPGLHKHVTSVRGFLKGENSQLCDRLYRRLHWSKDRSPVKIILSQCVTNIKADSVKNMMLALLKGIPNDRVLAVTPDRATEFSRYHEMGNQPKTRFFFPDPHVPRIE